MIDPKVTAFLPRKPWYAGTQNVTDNNAEADPNVGGAEADEELDPAPMPEGGQEGLASLIQNLAQATARILEVNPLSSAQSSVCKTQPMRSSLLPYANLAGHKLDDHECLTFLRKLASLMDDKLVDLDAMKATLQGLHGKDENGSEGWQAIVAQSEAYKRAEGHYNESSGDSDKGSVVSGSFKIFEHAVEHAAVEQTATKQVSIMAQQQKAKPGKDEAKFQPMRDRWKRFRPIKPLTGSSKGSTLMSIVEKVLGRKE